MADPAQALAYLVGRVEIERMQPAAQQSRENGSTSVAFMTPC